MLFLWLYLKSTRRSSLQKEVPLELFISHRYPFYLVCIDRVCIPIIEDTGYGERDRSSKEPHMQDMTHPRFPWRRALLMLMAIMIIVPALLLSFASLIPGTARAYGSASRVSPQGPGHRHPGGKPRCPPAAPLH